MEAAWRVMRGDALERDDTDSGSVSGGAGVAEAEREIWALFCDGDRGSNCPERGPSP